VAGEENLFPNWLLLPMVEETKFVNGNVWIVPEQCLNFVFDFVVWAYGVAQVNHCRYYKKGFRSLNIFLY
jgi:hypothetical protein